MKSGTFTNNTSFTASAATVDVPTGSTSMTKGHVINFTVPSRVTILLLTPIKDGKPQGQWQQYVGVTPGKTYQFAEVEEEAKKRNIDHPADLYYAINMLYSDLSNVLGKDPEKYIAVAKALYWDDPDMPEGKLFKQYVATI